MLTTAQERVSRHFDSLRSNRRSVFSGISFTLFSVIGGVAVGLIANALSQTVTGFVPPWRLNATQTIPVLLAARTFLVLAVVLVAYVLTVSYFYWEPSIVDVFTPLTFGLTLCLAAAHVDNPSTWVWWMSFSAFAAAGGLTRTARQLEPRTEGAPIPALGDLATIEELRDDLQRFAEQQRRRAISSRRWAIAGGFALLAYAILQYQLRWGAYDVLVIAAIIAAVCVVVLRSYRAAFAERDAVLGTPSYLLGQLEAQKGISTDLA